MWLWVAGFFPPGWALPPTHHSETNLEEILVTYRVVTAQNTIELADLIRELDGDVVSVTWTGRLFVVVTKAPVATWPVGGERR
jgi:hypothetical protein